MTTGDVHQQTVSATLVLYLNEPNQFEPCIASWLATDPTGLLAIVDNSPSPIASGLFADKRIKYLFAGANLGFGAGHNRGLDMLGYTSGLHLFLNPDITFEPETIRILGDSFLEAPDMVAAMPLVSYPDGEIQRLCKLLPTPLDLIGRRFIPFSSIRKQLAKNYELHEMSLDAKIEVPSISGCFLMVRSTALREVAGFDERYFMYMEDVDLVRRLAAHGRVMFLPEAAVCHGYAKGSYRNSRLLKYHIISAIRYFNKWGWLIDGDRSKRNKAVKAQIRANSLTDGQELK